MATPAPGAATPEPQNRRSTLQELGITTYVPPEFPRRARRRDISGLVDVEFTINADGSTDAIQVLHSEPGRVFEKSAVDAVRQWRFEPREAALQAQITLRFDIAP